MARRIVRRSRLFGRGSPPGRMPGKRSIATLFFLLLASPFSIVHGSSQGGEFRISTDVNLVLLDVSVKKPDGGSARELGKENFRVFEDGTPQKITEFASNDVAVAVGLLMDDSGSMRAKRAELISAGLAFVAASNSQDQIFVVKFNDAVRQGLPPAVPFTDDINLLRSALSIGRPEGRTVLYDAIAFALNHLESSRRAKKTLVVVSDGGDNASEMNFQHLLRLIRESRATIYTVGIFDEYDRDRSPQILKRISAVSGGESFLAESIDQVVPICQQIAKDIRTRYTIGYIPVRTSDKSAVHKIHVVAAAPDGRKLIVRTRTGYLLPEQTRSR
jgi:VWFA-related protein